MGGRRSSAAAGGAGGDERRLGKPDLRATGGLIYISCKWRPGNSADGDMIFEIFEGGTTMAWTTPTLVEICVGLEINGYLPAEF